jgi:hypothetical protein
MKILKKDDYHVLDRRYLSTNIHLSLYQEDYDYGELEQRVVDTGRVYQQIVGYLSANQNRNDGKCTATFSDLLNVVKKPRSMADETYINMLKSSVMFYEQAEGERRLSQFDIKLHRSFQIHNRKCFSFHEITDEKVIQSLNGKFNQKWIQAFEIQFFDGGKKYIFGSTSKIDPTLKNHYFVIRPRLTKFANSSDFKWEILIKYYHPCGTGGAKYVYDINHVDMDYVPKKARR